MNYNSQKTEYNGVLYDSVEESEFAMWGEEAMEVGLITDLLYHFDSFVLAEGQTYKKTIIKQLKTKVSTKVVDRCLFRGKTYTPDFKFTLTDKFFEYFPDSDIDILGTRDIIVDIKGTHMTSDASSLFSTLQKWTWIKHSIYVKKVIPYYLFTETWCPRKIYYDKRTKKLTPLKKYKKCKLLNEIIKENLF